MRALEELLASVHEGRSRQHLKEATRAYNAGAFKSAIVSLWVAVAVDLVAKVRQLAEQGEPAAVAHVAELDKAIENGNRQALMSLEQKLLDRCRDDYEFIDARDHVELVRLREDRHVCAHPAFVSTEDVFEPTAELVRAHIATAVDAVLRHGPTAGRKALERFQGEVMGMSWPEDPADLAQYLRDRYIDRGKHALRVNLAKVVVKGCISPPENLLVPWVRHAQAAVALDAVAPTVLGQALAWVVGRSESGGGLTDHQMVLFLGSLGDLSSAWAVIPASSIPRFAQVVTSSELAYLTSWRVLSASTGVAAVDAAIAARLDSPAVTDEQLSAVVAARPAAKFVPMALDQLAGTYSWRSAEYRMQYLVLPLAGFLGVAELQRISQVLRSVDDVRNASGMPQLLDRLYTLTMDVPGAATPWNDIVTFLETNGANDDPNDYYAYPQLRARVRGLAH